MQLGSSTHSSSSKLSTQPQPSARTDNPLPGEKTSVEFSASVRPRTRGSSNEKQSSAPNLFKEFVQTVNDIEDPKKQEELLNAIGFTKKRTPPPTEEAKQRYREIHAHLLQELAQSNPNLVSTEFLNLTAQVAPSVMLYLQATTLKPPTTHNQGGP